MNLSGWAGLTADRRQVLEAMIVHQTRSGEMPPLQYRAIHWRANLSAADLQALAILDPQQGAAEVGSGSAGDANRGKALFEKRCTGCHALDSDHEGPRLRGVFGRRAGSIPNFTYSPAVKASGITWNQDSLNKWLTDTDAMIPGNNMDFSVPKSAERADIVEYLRQLK
jgi:cytochrome c